MPIERDFLDGEGTLPILFHVSEDFEVWDGQIALILDHLLNHIKVLTTLAEGPVDQSVLDTLAAYPHYQIDRQRYLTGRTQAVATQTLIKECLTLLKCLATIAPIMEIEETKRTTFLEATRARVPFLDYHYVDGTYVSDARRED
jgi:hypothetical protein